MIGYAIGSQSNMEIGNVNKSTKKNTEKKKRKKDQHVPLCECKIGVELRLCHLFNLTAVAFVCFSNLV